MKMKNITLLLLLLIGSPCVPISSRASTGADYQAIPPFVTSGAPPLVMLVMGRNHKLYYEAYNDASDLNDDGILDIHYSPNTIDYYGYFDSYKCYEYNSANTRFEPTQKTVNKKCSGTSEWSGDFLNYLTMSRMDTMRKVLYGGYRSTDTTSETVLERVFIPQDAHSWAKEYTSVAVDGYDISDYTPFQLPNATGLRHLFGSTTLSDNGPPVLRVALNNPHRVWEWASDEAPVLDNSIVTTAGGHPGHPSNHTMFEAMVNTYATNSYLFGSSSWLNYSIRNHVDQEFPSPSNANFGAIDGGGNPWGSDYGYTDTHDWGAGDQNNYLAVFTGHLNVTTAGRYQIAVDGDDAVEVIIDGGTTNERVIGYYGAHEACRCTDNSDTLYLSAGSHTVEFRMEEDGEEDRYYLYWNGPDSGNNWTIIPNTAFADLTLSTYRLSTPASTITDYEVRVKVCDPSVGIEANCKLYPDGDYKPTGLLQRYGEAGRMYFGMMSGSYEKNTAGGVLRKNISSIQDEIDPDSGQFTGVNGIISTINHMRIVDYVYGSWAYRPGWPDAWVTTRPMNDGEFPDWGNPTGEIMYEALRYFAGKNSPTSAFDYQASGSIDEGLGLPKASWLDPYLYEDSNNNDVLDAGEDLNNNGHLDGFERCAKPFMLVLSDIYPTFDSDQVPGNEFQSFTGDLTDSSGNNPIDISDLLQTITNGEGISGVNYSIGESNGSYDGACTPKSVSNLGEIRGLCPEEPTKQGSYTAAGVAYYGNRIDISSSANDVQNVSTYAVGLASPLPRININIRNNTVTLIPFAKSVGVCLGISNAQGDFQPTNTIVDFYVEKITPTSGTFRVNFEDVEQAADHDMDAIAYYHYQVNDHGTPDVLDDTLDIEMSATYASGCIIQHLGYIISGTTRDGIYLEIRDQDTDPVDDVDYFLDTPPSQSPGGNYNDSVELPQHTTRTFIPGNSPGATLLKNPLWYAAKWGSFEDKDGDNTPNLQEEWDKDKDGVPDTYYYVTNPLRLEEQLNKSFADILNKASSGTAASVISNTRSGEGAIYQSVFFPSKTDTTSNANTVSWVGQIHALLTDAYGNMREDSNGNDKLDIAGPDLDGDGKVLHEDVNGNCVLDTEDTNGNDQLDAGEDLNGNNQLDTEDTNGNGILDVESTSGVCIPSTSVATDPYLSQLDAVIEYVNGKAVRYYDVNGNQILDPAERIWNRGDTNLNLDQIRYLWNSSDWLNDTALDPLTQRAWYMSDQKERYIFTWVDSDANGIVNSGEVQDFIWPSAAPSGADFYDISKIYPYLTLYPTFADKPAAIASLSSTDFATFLTEQTERQIKWIRGQDFIDLHGNPVPLNIGGSDVPGTEMRPRQFNGKTWRLGDIAYSTPTLVGRPAEAFHLLYNDSSYADFAAQYQNRRNVIYVGGNDGMLHAFNGGFFESYSKQFCREISTSFNPYDADTTNDAPCASSTIMPELGAELWAYVPYNLLPHLYWLTEPDYNHVYYVDQKPRVFDAKIFTDDPGHPNGWGTVMVVGMRFGGGQISTDVDRNDHPDSVVEPFTDGNGNGQYDTGESFVDCNGNGTYDSSPVTESYTDSNGNGTYDASAPEPFNDCNGDGVRQGLAPMRSAFIVMDITNPEEKPRLLAELVMPEMGYATSYPTVAVVKDKDADSPNKWYLAFGSGPADGNGQPSNHTDASDALMHARSWQDGKFYMVDLVKLASDNELWSLDDSGSEVQGLHVYATLESNSFVTDPISVDYNLDYKADVIYYGTINGDSGNGWGGQLHRIVIDNEPDTTLWDPDKTLINVNQPISAAPTVALDNEGRNWVFFGTGRFYVDADKLDKSRQSFYGIKEPVVDPTVLNKIKTWDLVGRSSLMDVTDVNVFTDTGHTVTGLGSGNTWNDLVTEQKENYSGWYLDFYADDGVTLEGERNLGQAALIGGLLSFTTFTPSDDICVASGESDLWALYYKTGTAFYNGILGTSTQVVNGVSLEKSLRKMSLGQGLATSPSIHTGREKGSVVFVQSSTGEIKRIEEDNPLSTKSGRLSWKLR